MSKVREITWNKIGPLLKAIAGGVSAGVFTLAGVITGDEVFNNVTLNEWLLVLLAVLASYGIVYRTPNITKETNDDNTSG